MFKNRLSRNILANITGFSLSVLVGIFFTPYLVRHLGVAGYGVIPLATTLSSYLTVVTLVVNGAVGRYITYSLQQNDVSTANRYFNTALFSSLIFVALLAGPSVWLTTLSDKIFNLPAGYENQVRWLISATVGMVLVSVVSCPFEVASFCKNRFDIRNLVTISATVIRIGVVVVLFTLTAPQIVHVGWGIVIAALVSFLASVMIWFRLTPELFISRKCFDVSCLRGLAGTGGWIMVSQVGTMLLLSIDLLVVNRMFGAEAGGRYATLLQWSILLRSLALTLAGVLAPTIISLYARHEIDELVDYSRRMVKVLGLFMALPVGFICGLSRPLLEVWVGADFVPLAPLLSLMVAPLCINLAYVPLHNISQATNKVRIPGIVQVAAGLINLALAIVLAGPLGWGMCGVAAAGVTVLTFRNVIFTPIYCARIIDRGSGTFMKGLLPISGITALIALVCWLTASCLDLTSWPRLIGFGLALSLAYGAIVWSVAFSGAGKQLNLKKVLAGREA